MKKILVNSLCALVLLLVGLLTSCAGGDGDGSSVEPYSWDLSVVDTARNVSYLSQVEKDVILEMNKARANPKRYAEEYIKAFGDLYDSDGNYHKNGINYRTNEGISAVNECISAMKSATPAQPLKPERGLAQAAKDHAQSQAPTGQTGHDGPDGSTPFTRISKYGTFSAAGENISYGSATGQDIVIDLLVDDGVPDRGHRDNILRTIYSQTGVGFVTNHTVYGAECVITYADGYKDK